MTRLKLFAGNANPDLAREICAFLSVPLGVALVKRFSDGEINVDIGENVRGADVFIVQPTCPPVNDHRITSYNVCYTKLLRYRPEVMGFERILAKTLICKAAGDVLSRHPTSMKEFTEMMKKHDIDVQEAVNKKGVITSYSIHYTK